MKPLTITSIRNMLDLYEKNLKKSKGHLKKATWIKGKSWTWTERLKYIDAILPKLTYNSIPYQSQLTMEFSSLFGDMNIQE